MFTKLYWLKIRANQLVKSQMVGSKLKLWVSVSSYCTGREAVLSVWYLNLSKYQWNGSKVIKRGKSVLNHRLMTVGVIWYLHHSFKSANWSKAAQEKCPRGPIWVFLQRRLLFFRVSPAPLGLIRWLHSCWPCGWPHLTMSSHERLRCPYPEEQRPLRSPTHLSPHLPNNQTLTHTGERRDKQQKTGCSLTVHSTPALR